MAGEKGKERRPRKPSAPRKRRRKATKVDTPAPADPEPRSRLLSLKAYARHRGVTRHAVQRAIETGRLRESAHRDHGRGWWRIDWTAADAEWARNTREGHASNAGVQLGPRADDLQGELFEEGASSSRPAAPASADPQRPTVTSYQAERMRWQAKLARLDYQEKAGRLVDAQSYHRKAFAATRHLRDELYRLPGSLASRLAALDDPDDVEAELLLEVERICRELAERFRRELEEEDADGDDDEVGGAA